MTEPIKQDAVGQKWALRSIFVDAQQAIANWFPIPARVKDGEIIEESIGFVTNAQHPAIIDLAAKLGNVLFEMAEKEDAIGGQMMPIGTTPSPRYEVLFRKLIRAGISTSHGSDVEVYRRVFLPCPPFPGLYVYDKEPGEEDEWEGAIHNGQVGYRADVNMWEVQSYDESRYKAMRNRNEPPAMETLVAEYLAAGWKLER